MKDNLPVYAAKKLPVIVLLLALTGAAPLFAIEFNFTPPEFQIFDAPPGYTVQELNTILNENLVTIFSTLEDSLNNDMGDRFSFAPNKLLKAFATSSVLSSDGATNRGYRGYRLLAISSGSMVGIQTPTGLNSIFSEMGNISQSFAETGDIELGFNPQIVNIQVGLNSSFLLKNLYLGAKIGYMNLPLDAMRFNTFSFGITGNYQFMANKNLFGALLWRGINFGTGFIYQKTSFVLDMPVDDYIGSSGMHSITFDNPDDPGHPHTVYAGVNNIKVDMGININTFTIPLEAVTSVRLLWLLNLSVGLGVDIGFGSSKLNLGASSDIQVETNTLDQYIRQTKPGSLSVDMGGAPQAPRAFNLKLMLGLGLSMGPVFLDVPFTLYIGNGYNMGVTLGVVF